MDISPTPVISFFYWAESKNQTDECTIHVRVSHKNAENMNYVWISSKNFRYLGSWYNESSRKKNKISIYIKILIYLIEFEFIFHRFPMKKNKFMPFYFICIIHFCTFFIFFFFHFDGFLHQQVFSICYTGVIHKLHSIWEWNKNRTYFFINSNLKLLVFSAIKSNFYIPAIKSLHKTIRGTRLRLSILDSKKFNSQLNWENSMFY